MAWTTDASWVVLYSILLTLLYDRFRNAANRLQLWMWPLCVPAQSLRAFMSSIMRWRSGLTAFVLIENS